MTETNADYVRRTYDVPAKRGMRVVFDGRAGVVTGFVDQYVKVLLDGERVAGRCHPTWRMDYLDGKGERG